MAQQYPPSPQMQPQQGGYPPQQGGYPPQQGGYPPSPQQGGYPPQQGEYPPQQYPPSPQMQPQQGGYPPQGYPPSGPPPQQGGYPPQGYPPSGPPPTQGSLPPQGYPPSGPPPTQGSLQPQGYPPSGPPPTQGYPQVSPQLSIYQAPIMVVRGTVRIRVRQAKGLEKKWETFAFIEYQGKEWASKHAKKSKDPVYNEFASFDLENLSQKSVIPVFVKEKGKHRETIGIAVIPLAGCVAGAEQIKSYKLERARQGEIEIGITTDFSMPPCDPLVYSAAVTDTIDGNLREIDPLTYLKHEREFQAREREKMEKKERSQENLKKAGNLLSKFVHIN